MFRKPIDQKYTPIPNFGLDEHTKANLENYASNHNLTIKFVSMDDRNNHGDAVTVENACLFNKDGNLHAQVYFSPDKRENVCLCEDEQYNAAVLSALSQRNNYKR